MKQNAKEPNYRSMNEVQFKYELIKLENKILDITGDPSTISTIAHCWTGAETMRRSRRPRALTISTYCAYSQNLYEMRIKYR